MKRLALLIRNYNFLLILLVISVLVSGIMYARYTKAQEDIRRLKENPTAIEAIETKELLNKVSKLIALPQSSEQPTIATVTDSSKLKDQPFFSRAKDGDKVLIYTEEKRAILYRPSINKIIDVAPVNIGQPQAQTTKVALYNGTATVGLASVIEKTLKEKLSGIDVVVKDNAANDYEKTLIIDLSGVRKDIVEQLAKFLGASIVSMPEDEAKPNADMLIILGKDVSGT